MGKRIIIAHRGYSAACPENTLPSFGAAVAIGADEIEFDLWQSRDGEAVVCHDPTVDRTSDGTGTIASLTWGEISGLDAGAWMCEVWRGVGFCRLGDVLRLFGGKIRMNIHVKGAQDGVEASTADFVRDIERELDRYNAREGAYIAGNVDVLESAVRVCPGLERCCLAGKKDNTIVKKAKEYSCKRLQFGKKYLTPELITEATEAGIWQNLFWSDELEEGEGFFTAGIDALLTNRCGLMMKLKNAQ